MFSDFFYVRGRRDKNYLVESNFHHCQGSIAEIRSVEGSAPGMSRVGLCSLYTAS